MAIAGVGVTVLTLLRLVSLWNTSPSTGCVGASCGVEQAALAAAPGLSYPCITNHHWLYAGTAGAHIRQSNNHRITWHCTYLLMLVEWWNVTDVWYIRFRSIEGLYAQLYITFSKKYWHLFVLIFYVVLLIYFIVHIMYIGFFIYLSKTFP